MGFTVKAGKKYLKKFEEYIYDDGVYTWQILSAKSNGGNVTFKLGTSDGHVLYKTYFTKGKEKGTINERATRDVSALVTTAMQIEDEEVSVDIGDSVGFYFQAKLVNNYYDNEAGEQKHVVYLNDVTQADCFPDGTPSLLTEAQKRVLARKASRAAVAQPQEEPVEEEEVVEEESEVSVDPLKDFLGM
jgi:hypothetical protein